MRIAIKNGTIVDGTGKPAYRGDLLIDGGLICQAGGTVSGKVDETVDATGLLVTPGFIDIHRHCDIQPLINPRFGEIEGRQGITTVVAGNCGLSNVPFTEQSGDDVLALVRPCLGPVTRRTTFSSYQAYIEALSKGGLSLEFGFLAGTGAIRSAVKGFSKEPFSEQELKRAVSFMHEAMDSGALGASMGIMYPPERYNCIDDYVALLRPVAEAGRIVSCHMRGESDSLVSSVAEAIETARRTGVRFNISHFKSNGKRNWRKKIFEAVSLIDQARTNGIIMTCDFYPYAGGSTTLQSLIPPDCFMENTEATCTFLASKKGVEHLRESITQQFPKWDNMVLGIGWDRVIISYIPVPEYASLAGMDFSRAAKMTGMDEAMLLATLFVKAHGDVGIVIMSMDPEDVAFVATLPYSSVISDSLYPTSGHPHPRLYGSFPAFLRTYVCEKHLLSLPEAVAKMTNMNAEKMGMSDRGTLEVGKRADVNAFALDAFHDLATYRDPCRLAEGLTLSLVGGEVVVRNDVWQESRKGSLVLAQNKA